MTNVLTPNQVLDEVRSSHSTKVKLAVTDIDGVLRGKYVAKEKFMSAVESGFGFCNVVFGWDCNDVCYDNTTYTGWHTGYPDAQARIDLQSYRHVPWDNQVPFFLGDFVDADGAPLPVCPRQLLKSVISKARDMGFVATFGCEFEWFNFRETPQSLSDKGYRDPKPISPGMFGYSLLRAAQCRDFFAALMDDMAAFGVPIEGLHTETGPGVFEAAILYSDALEAADRAVLFKTAAKEIGHRFGIMPTFMAKWDANLPGCGGHLHQSLRHLSSGESAFYDANHPHRMSSLFESYLAGQIAGLPYVLPLLAPTINSYKRLVEGLWAPTLVTWGVDNRTTALRVIPGSRTSTRLETRVGGADINPYLAVAAALGCGLYGIEKGLRLQDAPVVGNGYLVQDAIRLPGNLHDAAIAMQQSSLAREVLSQAFVEHFAATRLWEWRQYQRAVTNWELQRYFEII